MAVTLVSSVSATPGANGGATGAIDTTGATLLVLSVAFYSGTTANPTISDSKSNTWIALTVRAATFTSLRLYYCLTPTVGTGHTFSATGTTISCAILAYAFAGVASYQTESGIGGVSASPAVAGSAVTPSANGALIVTGRVANAAATDAISPAGFTITTKPFVGGTNEQGSAAYYVQPAAAAINPSWSWSGGSPSENAVATAVFLAALVTSTEHAYTFVGVPL